MLLVFFPSSECQLTLFTKPGPSPLLPLYQYFFCRHKIMLLDKKLATVLEPQKAV
jgi:hypothetical protein